MARRTWYDEAPSKGAKNPYPYFFLMLHDLLRSRWRAPALDYDFYAGLISATSES